MAKKILLVDDDPSIRDILTTILKNEKYDIVKAGNGKEALLALELNPGAIDLILSDIIMEQMDGFEFIKIVKANQLWKSIPFIFLSAKVDSQSRIMGLRLGADDYINKPFNKDEVVAKINSYLEKVNTLKTRLTVTGLSGNLRETKMKDLFQVINITKKSGMLVLVGSRVAGALYFKNGILINAEKEDRMSESWGGLWGEQSARELMSLTEGNFRFEPKPVNDIQIAITNSMDEILYQLDNINPEEPDDASVGLVAVRQIDDTLNDREKGIVQLVALNPNITSKEIEHILGPASISMLSELLSKGYLRGGKKKEIPVMSADAVIGKLRNYKNQRGVYSIHVGLIASKDNADKFFGLLATNISTKPERMPFERTNPLTSNPNFNIYKLTIKDQIVEFHTFYYKSNQEFLFNAIFRPTIGIIVLKDAASAPDMERFVRYTEQQKIKFAAFDTEDISASLDFNQVLILLDQIV